MNFLFSLFSELEGFVALQHLTKKVVSQNFQLTDTVEKAMFKQFHKVTNDTSLGFVSRILETDEFAAVVDDKYHCIGVVNHLDLLNFIAGGPNLLKKGIVTAQNGH